MAIGDSVGEKVRELIEGCDFGGARPGEALRDSGYLVLGKQAAYRCDDSLTVGLRCLLRINL